MRSAELGQLGRHVANDQGKAPGSGGSHRVPLWKEVPFHHGSACRAATTLEGVDGFEVPSWSDAQDEPRGTSTVEVTEWAVC